jgi:tripartite-type tricarboxylate transporter receptor subunit TctC
LPELPALSDFVPGYEASVFYGVGAPRSTPAEIVNEINNEINAAFIDPGMNGPLADLGGTPLLGSPADFGKLIADEAAKWAKVVKSTGIRAE